MNSLLLFLLCITAFAQGTEFNDNNYCIMCNITSTRVQQGQWSVKRELSRRLTEMTATLNLVLVREETVAMASLEETDCPALQAGMRA